MRLSILCCHKDKYKPLICSFNSTSPCIQCNTPSQYRRCSLDLMHELMNSDTNGCLTPPSFTIPAFSCPFLFARLFIRFCVHHTMIQKNQELGRSYWSTPSVCIFTRTAHSFTCSATLIHSITCPQTHSWACGKVDDWMSQHWAALDHNAPEIKLAALDHFFRQDGVRPRSWLSSGKSNIFTMNSKIWSGF